MRVPIVLSATVRFWWPLLVSAFGERLAWVGGRLWQAAAFSVLIVLNTTDRLWRPLYYLKCHRQLLVTAFGGRFVTLSATDRF